MLPALFLAFLPLLLVRILRPLVVVRFGALPGGKMSRYIGGTEIFLSELDAGMHKGRFLDVFYHDMPICNYNLKAMWDRTLRVWQWARPIDLVNRALPGGNVHRMPWRAEYEFDVHLVLDRTESHLNFTQNEKAEAQRSIESMGLPVDAPYICFHARDGEYQLAVDRDAVAEVERSLPNNSDIQTYLPAAEHMTKHGLYALRVGAIVKEPIKTANPMIIDYATKARSELLDLYLAANCEFFVASSDGITLIPVAFRRPVVHVNVVEIINEFYQFGVTWSRHDLWIPKILWLRSEGRPVTFREMIRWKEEIKYGAWIRSARGIELVDNTADEIKAVTIEMHERLQGTWEPDPEDEELQRRFWSIYDPTGDYRVPRARIGADFLRTNLDLFD